jgi:distribution and morphology protein 31
MLYDILSANSIVGMFDNCLFSLHKTTPDAVRHHPGVETMDLKYKIDNYYVNGNGELINQNYKKLNHLKVNGIKIEHLNRNTSGPFSWITQGTVDIDALLGLPTDLNSDEDVLDLIVNEVDKRINNLPKNKKIMMEFDVKLNNLKASVPIMNPDLTYLNNALVRPIVGYMNNNRVSIPLRFQSEMDLENFNGAWTIYSDKLTDVISESIGKSLIQLVQDEKERTKHLKKVGLWTIQSLSKNITYFYDYVKGSVTNYPDIGIYDPWHYFYSKSDQNSPIPDTNTNLYK